MKVISCYVAGFGTLRDRTFTFTDGINTVFLPNGAGKTTLAAFLRVMLYGMSTARANAKDFPDRVHYLPFSDAPFGGTLTVEWRGDEYRIERKFGRKSDRDDTLNLIVNGREVPPPEGSLGAALFGLDEKSFFRTVFLTPEASATGVTDAISAKLNRMADAADESNSADAAQKRLDDAIRRLQSTRGGELAARRDEARALDARIRNLEAAERCLPGLYASRRRLEAERNRLEELEKSAAARAEYRRLTALRDSHAADADAIRARYPDGLPDENELRRLTDAASGAASAFAALEKAHAPEEKARLAALRARYPHGLPDAEELDALDLLARRCDADRAALAVQTLTEDEQNELARLTALREAGRLPDADALAHWREVSDRLRSVDGALRSLTSQRSAEPDNPSAPALYAASPDPEGLSEAEAAAGRLRTAARELSDTNTALSDLRAAQKSRAEAERQAQNRRLRRLRPLAVLGLLLLIAGCVLLVRHPAPGAILTGAGLILLCCWLFPTLRASRRAAVPASDAEEELTRRLRTLRDGITADEAVISGFLSRYGAASDRPLADFAAFSADKKAYDADAERKKSLDARIRAGQTLRRGLWEELNGFLTVRGIAPDCGLSAADAALDAADRDLSALDALCARARAVRAARDERSERLAADVAAADEILARFGLSLPDGDGNAAFCAALRADAGALLELTAARTDKKRAQAAAGARLGASIAAARAVLEKYRFDLPLAAPDDFARLPALAARLGTDRTLLDKAQADLAAAESDAASFAAANGLCGGADPAGDGLPLPAGLPDDADGDALFAGLSRLRGEIAGLDREIDEKERDADLLPDLRARADESRAASEAAEHRLFLLRTTRELIRQADQTLRDKYVDPVRARFLDYVGRVEALLGERIRMDADYAIGFESGGMLRGVRYLSAGQRDLCQFCLRLALLDQIFPGERPMIVLDDPFASLDAGHFAGVARVIRELAADRQIVYFCCHESRMI